MQTIKEKHTQDQAIMRIIKTSEIRHILAHTDKGDLTLMIRKDESPKDYHFLLDAVPFENKVNKELLALFDGILYTL